MACLSTAGMRYEAGPSAKARSPCDTDPHDFRPKGHPLQTECAYTCTRFQGRNMAVAGLSRALRAGASRCFQPGGDAVSAAGFDVRKTQR